MERKLAAFIGLPLIIFLLLLATLSLPRSVQAQDCGGPVPPTPAGFSAVTGPLSGQITLSWNGTPHANRYAVAYGLSSNSYIYGADNIGGESARKFTVSFLNPGNRYYFRLAAARDCSSSPFSQEVSAVAAGVPGEVMIPAQSTQGDQTAIVEPVASVQPVIQAVPAVATSRGTGRLNLRASTGPSAGQVTLSWNHADSAEDYHLIYGTGVGKEEFGALNIGRLQNYTVGYLVPGQTYYFALIPIFSNRPLYTSSWVKANAKQVIQVIQTTPEAIGAPVSKDKKKKTPATSTSSKSKEKDSSKEATPTKPSGQ